MLSAVAIDRIAATLRTSRGIAAKRDIAAAVARLGVSGDSVLPVGDDCAAIPDSDGYLLLAIEGFMNEFVAGDPWFAGWCGVMVNISDVAAMGGGRSPWSTRCGRRAPAMPSRCWRACRPPRAPLACRWSVATPTRAPTAVSSPSRSSPRQASAHLVRRDARRPAGGGDRPAGRYREPFPNWEAATDAPPARLRGDLEVLPAIAEAGLACAAKDISQGGIVGTTMMLAECSGIAATIDVTAVPRPAGVALERWLQTFPSFGYILAVAPSKVDAVIGRFAARGIAAAEVGAFSRGARVAITDGRATETIWDFEREPLIGCGRARLLTAEVPA